MTKDELKEYIDIKREREHLSSILAKLEAEMYAPGTQKLTGMPRVSSGKNSALEGYVEKHIALMDRYCAMIDKLATTQAKIEEAIESLDSVERTLMRHKYIDGLTWDAICATMHYSWGSVHRIHGSALEKLREQ